MRIIVDVGHVLVDDSCNLTVTDKDGHNHCLRCTEKEAFGAVWALDLVGAKIELSERYAERLGKRNTLVGAKHGWPSHRAATGR